MNTIQYLKRGSSQVFSRLELAIIDFLSKCPEGATVHEIAKSVGCCFKSLYWVLKMFEKNGWVTVTRKSEGRVGRPVNRYKLTRDSSESILREIYIFRDREVNLDLSNIIYPYSLTIFKRATDGLKQNELLTLLVNHTVDYRLFIEVAYKKNIKPLTILFNGSRIKILFKKSSTA
jgi:DNA-binding PadR family transcriptional regulator